MKGVLIVSAAALLGPVSQASANTLPAAIYDGQVLVDVNSDNPGVFVPGFGYVPTSSTFDQPVTGSGTISSGQISQPNGGVASGNVTITNQPYISVGGSTGGGIYGSSYVDVTGKLTYSIEILGPQPTVSVQVEANGQTSIPNTPQYGSADANLYIYQGPTTVFLHDEASTNASNGMSGSFTENGTYVFDTNTIYTVYLEANVFSQPLAGVGDPSLDPQFIVPVGFSLELSQDISNGTTTPLPAALPLFGTGLGVMGLLAKRRRRKDAAIAGA